MADPEFPRRGTPTPAYGVNVYYYRLHRSLGQGNVFRSVCQEFCPQGGYASVYAGIPPPPLWNQAGTALGPSRHTPGPGTPPEPGTPCSRHPPRAGTLLPPGAGTPPTRHPQRSACWEMRATSRRYPSYWNAYLFSKIFDRNCIVFRKAQYKDVYRRTIEIPQGTRIFKANCWLNAQLKLTSHREVELRP